MTQELSKEELQIIKDGLARRRSQLAEAQGAAQGLAYELLTSKCVNAGYLIRDMSLMSLLPDVSLIILKLEESDEIPKETLEYLWLSEITTVFWTEVDRCEKEEFEVLQYPSEEDWTSFLTSLCAKPKSVVTNLAAKEVYKLVKQLEDKKGPVLYLGKENKDCPAMACAGVAISCGIDGTEAAKTCSSIIGFEGWPSTLKSLPEIRAAAKQARDEPIKVLGCFPYTCVMICVILRTVLCFAPCCPYSPQQREKRRQNTSQRLQAIAMSWPQDPVAKQIGAANDSRV